MFSTRIEDNTTAIRCYIESMLCAVGKAEKGSTAEKMYFLEKLEKLANRIGFDLIEKEK